MCAVLYWVCKFTKRQCHSTLFVFKLFHKQHVDNLTSLMLDPFEMLLCILIQASPCFEMNFKTQYKTN